MTLRAKLLINLRLSRKEEAQSGCGAVHAELRKKSTEIRLLTNLLNPVDAYARINTGRMDRPAVVFIGYIQRLKPAVITLRAQAMRIMDTEALSSGSTHLRSFEMSFTQAMKCTLINMVKSIQALIVLITMATTSLVTASGLLVRNRTIIAGQGFIIRNQSIRRH